MLGIPMVSDGIRAVWAFNVSTTFGRRTVALDKRWRRISQNRRTMLIKLVHRWPQPTERKRLRPQSRTRATPKEVKKARVLHTLGLTSRSEKSDWTPSSGNSKGSIEGGPISLCAPTQTMSDAAAMRHSLRAKKNEVGTNRVGKRRLLRKMSKARPTRLGPHGPHHLHQQAGDIEPFKCVVGKIRSRGDKERKQKSPRLLWPQLRKRAELCLRHRCAAKAPALRHRWAAKIIKICTLFYEKQKTPNTQ